MPRQTVVHDDENIRVIKVSGGGSKTPRSYKIEMKDKVAGYYGRKLQISIDELFDLTEILDDICDYEEDRDKEQESNEDLYETTLNSMRE